MPTFYPDLRHDDFPRDLVLSGHGSIEGRARLPWRSPATVGYVRARLVGTLCARDASLEFDGSFGFPRLTPGRYELLLVDGWAALEARGDVEFSRVVDVRAGETSVVEIEETRDGALIHGFVRNDPWNDPFGMFVEAWRTEEPFDLVATGRVGFDAVFGIGPIPPATYRVVLRSQRAGQMVRLEQEVSVAAPGARATIEFDLGRAGWTGRVIPARGAPGSVDLEWIEVDTGKVATTLRANSSGEFRLVTSAVGPHRLVARAAGCREQWLEPVALPLPPDHPPCELFLDVESRLAVEVVDDRGTAIVDASVEVIDRERPSDLSPLRRQSGLDGRTTFTNLADRRVEVHVAMEGHVVPAPVAVTLARDREERLRVVLARLGALEVALVSAPEATRLDCGLIGLDEANQSVQTIRALSDSDPAVFSELPPGRYQVEVDDQSSEVRVDPGARARLEWSLEERR